MSFSTRNGGVVTQYEVITTREIFNRRFEQADVLASNFCSEANYVMCQQQQERQVKGR